MEKVAIDDFAKIKKLGSLALSPSGRKAVFTVTEGSIAENKYRTDLWVYDCDRSPALFRLTAGEDGKAPLFENENTVLFPGDRKKRHQGNAAEKNTVFNRISLLGGEAEEAFVLPFPASSLKMLGENTFLCVGERDLSIPDLSAMDKDAKAEALQQLEEEKDYEVFDELPFWFNGRGVINKKRTALFLCDGKENTQKLLTEDYFDLHGFAVNEEKTRVCFWGTEFTRVNSQKSRMFLMTLSDLSRTEVQLNGRYRVGSADFVGENVIFSAATGEEYGSSENSKFYTLAPDGSFTLLCAPDLSMGGVGSDIAGGGNAGTQGEGVYFVHTRNYRSCFSKLSPDGTISDLVDEVNIVSAACGIDPIFFIGMETDAPQELYKKESGKVEKLSSFNAAYLESHEIAHTEHFTFINPENVELDGWVLYPEDFDESKTYPAILDVHGGPKVAYGEGFFHEMQYWAGCGYIVFFCNPRGSSGRGDAFADIYGDNYGVRDYNDLMCFTDEVLKRVPQIDASRVCMTGGSYGGFMANWIIGHTDRFAAVASQRSISNYLSKCLTTDIGYYHNLSAIQADPWTSFEKMWAHSPLAYADKVKTPTLFIQSDEDYRCWMGDAIQMLQALLMHDVPARMCLFHGENHELSRSGKPKHRVRRLKEITDWFDTYTKA